MGPTCSRMRALTLRPSSMAAKQRPLAAHEAAGHFVDGEHGGDGQAAFDGFDDAVMVVGVDLVAALDQHDVGAHAFGVGNDGAGPDAEGLGLVAGGDADGCVGHHGDDADWTAAQLGAHLLLDRGEIGVQIDEEPVHHGTGDRLGVAASRGESPGSASGTLPAILPGREAGSGLLLLDHSAIYFRLLFS